MLTPRLRTPAASEFPTRVQEVDSSIPRSQIRPAYTHSWAADMIGLTATKKPPFRGENHFVCCRVASNGTPKSRQKGRGAQVFEIFKFGAQTWGARVPKWPFRGTREPLCSGGLKGFGHCGGN